MEKKSWSKQSFYENSDLIARFVELYYSTANAPFDYGNGESFTGYEAHVVSRIADNPGICLTELADQSSRTKGAVSIMLKKLESKGLIARAKSYNGSKLVHLFVTPKGAKLDAAHKARDEKLGQDLHAHFLSRYPDKDIDVFFSILNDFLNYLEASAPRDS